jgi:uncharacterized protein (TIGR02001 family)
MTTQRIKRLNILALVLRRWYQRGISFTYKNITRELVPTRKHMMKKVALCLLLVSAAAHAAEDIPAGSTAGVSTSAESTSETKAQAYGDFSGNMALGSDYIFRGQTLTAHKASAQGEVDWTHPSGYYVGVWGANVNLQGSDAKAEFDEYGGYTYALTPMISASVGALYYSYWQHSDINTLEFPLLVTVNQSTKLGLAYSPHWGGGDSGHAYYASAVWSDKVKWDTTLTFGAGYSIFDPALDITNYADFHAGLTHDFFKLSWDVSGYFVNTQQEQFNGADDPRVVFTMSKTL